MNFVARPWLCRARSILVHLLALLPHLGEGDVAGVFNLGIEPLYLAHCDKLDCH